MPTKSPVPTSTWKRRIGAPHFAYLRAWVEGLDRDDAARRYLGLEHGHELVSLHRQVVGELRALARRRGDSRWRLIGIDVGAKAAADAGQTGAGGLTPPPLETWAAEHGLEDFSYEEQLLAWQEAFPVDHAAERRQRRSVRLRERQLEILKDLERHAATPAAATDPVDAWFEPHLATKLQQAGFVMLGELASAIHRGDRWYREMKGVGVGKARRIEAYLAALLPAAAQTPAPVPHAIMKSALHAMISSTRALISSKAPMISSPSDLMSAQPPAAPAGVHALDGSRGANRSERKPTIDAADDRQAIDAWLSATAARSPATQAAYRKEAERWLLWCVVERGKPLSSANIDDCLEYMRFLNDIPQSWQSRRSATRMGLGWTPFKGQLGLESRRYAVKVLYRLCAWLTDQARYLDHNPWGSVDRRLVDGDELPAPPTSKALSREAFACLSASLPNPAQPGLTRNGFVLHFGRYTGLRAAELLAATVGSLERTDVGWRIYVVGKGRKPRHVTVPGPAVAVLQQHLQARGLPPLTECPKDVPLLGSQADPPARPTYSAVHQSFTAWVRRALRTADLPPDERLRMQRATQHWLRHTFATRSAEAEVPPDVLQAELGHSDPATTAAYYKAAERRRQEAMERAAAG